MIFMSKKEETLALLLKKMHLNEQFRNNGTIEIVFLIKYVRGIILKIPELRSRLMY